MTWQIWLAVAVIAVTVFGLVKRYETRMVLLVAGFFLCIAAGEPMKAFQAFIKGMTNVTLVSSICAAMGFAAAVSAAQCDRHLVAAVAKPLKKLGGLLIPSTMFLTFLINIAVMSAAGTAAMAGATFIPLLLRAGIKPAAAAAAVGAGTMTGLFLNPGCAHDIFVAKIAKIGVVDFIAFLAPYAVGLVVLAIVINSALMILRKEHKGESVEGAAPKAGEPELKVNFLKAVAPLVPLAVLVAATIWFPKAGIEVVAAMLIGILFVEIVTLMDPGELSKAFFKGCGNGYAQVIGLIVAAGVFAAGLQATGTVAAFIDYLKHSNEFARWGAALGPFLMALGTGSGEAAIWAFNQAVTPEAASFGMRPEGLGLLAMLAGQFGRTASPLAGCIIIVAGFAGVNPIAVAKRLFPGMFVAVILAAVLVV